MNEQAEEKPAPTKSEIDALEKKANWAIAKVRNRIARACDGHPMPAVIYALAEVFYDACANHGIEIERVGQILGMIHAERLSQQPKADPPLIVTP